MVRAFLRQSFRALLRIFFRKIELTGVQNIPPRDGVIFAVNHPNGLVDPLFLIGYSPRPVSFLAKAPLFRMPVIGFLARAIGSIPVYRAQDQLDPKKNAETFTAARSLLTRGGSIAIFPEGTTHSDPALKPLKTGAARIALGANCAAEANVVIVPTGINYTAKTTFRSNVLVTFGEPLPAGRCVVDSSGEPDRDAVRALTDRITESLKRVTLQADSHAALQLVREAEDIFSSASPAELAAEHDLQRRLIDGYARARELMPARVERLEAHVARFSAELDEARLAAHELDRGRSPAQSLRRLGRGLAFAALLLPIGVVGTAIHFVPYVLVDLLVRFASRDEEEMVGTLKVIAGALCYGAAWAAVSLLARHFLGTAIGVLVLVLLPFVAVGTIWFWEKVDVIVGTARALLYAAFKNYAYRRLLAERRSIREEIAAIAEELERSPR